MSKNAPKRTLDQIAIDRERLKLDAANRIVAKNLTRFTLYNSYCDYCEIQKSILAIMKNFEEEKGVVTSVLNIMRGMGLLNIIKINSRLFEYKTIKYPEINEVVERFKVTINIRPEYEPSPGGVVYSFEKAGKLRDNYIEQCKIDRINRVSEKVHVNGGQTYAMW